ncbi:hypothetical protein ACMGE7_00520 [Macrococcus equi]|uniref:hypothetical protein n=1 Tax=Macrococcus equi TaxID=3395462 RepID=UPI0039BE176D
MNEEEKISLLIDERTELIPHEIVYDKEAMMQNNEDPLNDMQSLIQQERMTTEEILREIAEEEELETENLQAEEEVKLYKYIVNTIKYHEGDNITIQQLYNIAAHESSTLTKSDLDVLLNDYVEAGYLRVEDEQVFVTFLGQHVMTLL